MAGELRPDIEAAKNKMQARLGAGRELKKLTSYLWEGEHVHLLSAGTYGPGTGLLVLTERRLLFVMDGWLNQTIEDFPLEKISSVQWSSGIALGSITVFSSGNKAEIKQVNKKDGQQITDALRNRLSSTDIPSTSPPAAPSAASAADGPYEQLRKLGELRDSGVISDEEFENKKRSLLDRI